MVPSAKNEISEFDHSSSEKECLLTYITVLPHMKDSSINIFHILSSPFSHATNLVFRLTTLIDNATHCTYTCGYDKLLIEMEGTRGMVLVLSSTPPPLASHIDQLCHLEWPRVPLFGSRHWRSTYHATTKRQQRHTCMSRSHACLPIASFQQVPS